MVEGEEGGGIGEKVPGATQPPPYRAVAKISIVPVQYIFRVPPYNLSTRAERVIDVGVTAGSICQNLQTQSISFKPSTSILVFSKRQSR